MTTPITFYTDGGSRGNPGPAAAAFWVPSLQRGKSLFLGEATNNVAEYEAVLLALSYADMSCIYDVRIKADSKVIVNQIRGLWRINFPHLQSLKDKVDQFVDRLSSFEIIHVKRGANTEADRLCNECLDFEEAKAA